MARLKVLLSAVGIAAFRGRYCSSVRLIRPTPLFTLLCISLTSSEGSSSLLEGIWSRGCRCFFGGGLRGGIFNETLDSDLLQGIPGSNHDKTVGLGELGDRKGK